MNTTPGMTRDSNFTAGAGLLGLTHADILAAILREALARTRYAAPLPVPDFTAGPCATEPTGEAARPLPPLHDVPMCRQLISPDEWAEYGGSALGDSAEWSDRACGMAALRMILLAYLGDAPPLTELVMTGVRAAALTDRGCTPG